MHVCIHIYIHVNKNTCIYIYIYVPVCACVYACLHMLYESVLPAVQGHDLSMSSKFDELFRDRVWSKATSEKETMQACYMRVLTYASITGHIICVVHGLCLGV